MSFTPPVPGIQKPPPQRQLRRGGLEAQDSLRLAVCLEGCEGGGNRFLLGGKHHPFGSGMNKHLTFLDKTQTLGGKMLLKQRPLHYMNILCLTSWGMGAWVEFQLYIVSNKSFPHQARLAKASTLKQHISASSMEQSWSSRNIHSARPFQTQQKTTPARTNVSGFSPCQISRRFTVFHCKKRCSRQFHGIFTLFPLAISHC